MVAHGAGVARNRVALAARAQLGPWRLGRRLDPGRAGRGEREPRAVDVRWLPAVQHLDDLVDVVDVELAADVGAPEAELAWRAQRMRDRLR